MKLSAFIKILRPRNAVMAGGAVVLGYWLTGSEFSVRNMIFLVLAAIASTGFGNVLNDILDISTDRISHPDRPLPRGDISINQASVYSVLLVITALFLSFSVSPAHGLATFIPLIILLLYAFFLKGTPLAGNIVVASLVAYALLYGGINRPVFHILFIPAFLAFLLNLPREIIKDIQDEKGDKIAGYTTTASLPRSLLKGIIFGCSGIYISFLFIPFILSQFGFIYGLVSLSVVLPIHIKRTILFRADMEKMLFRISALYKVEMIAGLAAIAADKFFLSSIHLVR
jgi:geranylgeranylglycerol-phosphate geranylgeranyltransferase